MERYRRVHGAPVKPLWWLLAAPVAFLLFHLVTNNSVASAALSVLSAAVAAVVHGTRIKRRIVTNKTTLTETYPPATSQREILNALKTLEYYDDEHTPQGPALIPYYTSHINHLATAADALDAPKERHQALEAIQELNTRWSGALVDYHLEMEYWQQQGDAILEHIRGPQAGLNERTDAPEPQQ